MSPKGYLQQDALEKERSCLADAENFLEAHHPLREDWEERGEYRFFNNTGQLMCYNTSVIDLFEEIECPTYVKKYNNLAIQYYNQILQVKRSYGGGIFTGRIVKDIHPTWKSFRDLTKFNETRVELDDKDYDYLHD